MTPSGRRPTSRGAIAGSLLVVVTVLCAAAGFALGAAVGAPVPLGLAGLLLGAAVGFAVVRARFRDL